MVMERVNSPEDLKGLSVTELVTLSEEIRGFLLENISQTGGHLASNLGVVELTVALHKAFDSPTDKIIWDVGHQSYIHKILTGRRGQFGTLRRLDGLSGFPKSSESPHDAFDTGHSSTAISAALGYCAARDLRNEDYAVAAVVGDGSMTGGLVYEALNNAGRANTDILVILNDNEMSISKNVGAVSRHLHDIRTAPIYRRTKQDVHKLLESIPRLGKRVDKVIESVKDGLKYMLVQGVLFEKMGFQYFGPVDGHDLRALMATFRNLRGIKGPVLLHVVTTKGKGYAQAEESPTEYHGVDTFEIETGEPTAEYLGMSYTQIFGRTLLRLAEREPNLVAITAAMPDNTGLLPFQEKYPRRFFDVGIAEGHALTFAAGLAKGGLIPVVAVFSSFLQRAYDQILHDVCTQNLHVIIAVDRAGLVGPDGETHQGLFDLSFLAHIPNMTILAPKNRYELADMFEYAVFRHKAPIAVRYPRSVASRVLKDSRLPIVPFEAETVIKGEGAALVSVGAMMDEAHPAVEEIRKKGYNVSLYNARFVKPLPQKLTEDLRTYRHVFILEDNVQSGGFGERLWAAVLGQEVHFMAFPDNFVEHGSREELLHRYGLDREGIVKRMLKVLG